MTHSCHRFFIHGTKKKEIRWKDNIFTFLFLYLESFICQGDCDWISLHASFYYNPLNFLVVHCFHSHILKENPIWSANFSLLYLISLTRLLLCSRPVWLTGLRSAFSQLCEDRLSSNWRYRNVIFHCSGAWFTLYFHLTYPVLKTCLTVRGGHTSFLLISHLRHSNIWKICVKTALIQI